MEITVLNALDKLALALTEHKHQWTSEERSLYEEATSSFLDRKERGCEAQERYVSRLPLRRPPMVSGQASTR